MDDQLYREIILEHWKNPQNYGVIDNADIDITDSNPLCGDEIRITASVILNGVQRSEESRGNQDNSRDPSQAQDDNVVSDIKFIGQGCAISKASASLFTDYIKDKSIKEIKNMPQEEALELLSIQLTPTRLKCALLPYSTFHKALTHL